MNGQTGRQAIVREVVQTCGIEQIVETGTYRGATTEWFAAFGLPVHSVEIDPINGHFCSMRLAGFRNVTVTIGDSVDYLGRLATSDATKLKTLFYLDAHWKRRLPLADELRIVVTRFPSAVVVIDDFLVPDDPGYGFDDYGPGRRLDLDYIASSKLGEPETYFPSMPAAEETGNRRGCVVIPVGRDMALRLANVSGLRRNVALTTAPGAPTVGG